MGSPVESFSMIPQKVDTQTEVIKRFLLVGQGDFIQELIDNIGEELDKSVALISSNVLKGGIDNAIKNSSANYLSE
jgi:gamma-tubulin complex component 3